MTQEAHKQLVGTKVVDVIESSTTIGLGTGSTVFYTIQEIGKRLKEGELEGIQGVCTSVDTENKAKKAGIDILNINEVEKIDIAIDGADEVDQELNLIKGGGGALTREKIIDYMAEKFIVIVDGKKMKQVLGDFPIPVEVLPFSWFQAKKHLENLGSSVSLRVLSTNQPFVTDNNNYILDAKFSHVLKPERLEQIINNLPGVLENGIFRAEKVTQVWVGSDKGIAVLPK
ncbi:MAG: ribose-5-phosphate isomerase RpiA [archaeon]